MNSITVHRLALQFDADQITSGQPHAQAIAAVVLINTILQREPFGLSAQLIAARDEIEVESSVCEGCEGRGWVKCNTGNDESPEIQIQRCDACEQFDSDEEAQHAADHEKQCDPHRSSGEPPAVKINKITPGFVIQTFDTDKHKWTGQKFVAGNPVEYEEAETGKAVHPTEIWRDEPKPYLPFDMKQPELPDYA